MTTSEDFARKFKQQVAQKPAQVMSKQDSSDVAKQRDNQISEAVILAGIVHPQPFNKDDANLLKISGDIDTFFQLVVTNVSGHHGVFYRYLGSMLICAFGAPPSVSEGISDSLNALDAVREISAQLHLLNAQRSAEVKTILNTGFGIVFGKTIGGNRGFEKYASYELVGWSSYLAMALAYAAQGGQCFATSEFVARLPDQERFQSQRIVELANGITQPVYIITS